MDRGRDGLKTGKNVRISFMDDLFVLCMYASKLADIINFQFTIKYSDIFFNIFTHDGSLQFLHLER